VLTTEEHAGKGCWSGQRRAPAVFSLRKSLGTHYIGSWVGPRDGLKGNGEKKIPGFQLYRLRSPGPRTHCVAYTAHRLVRKADRCTARLVSPKCVLAHASRFQRTSDSPQYSQSRICISTRHGSYRICEIRH